MTSLGTPFSRARFSADSRTFGSYTSRSMSTWRFVRVKGRISRCSRLPISSSTMLMRRRTNHRAPGRRRRSTAPRAASSTRTARPHVGRVTCPVTGPVYHHPMGYNPGREGGMPEPETGGERGGVSVVLVHGLWMTGREMRVLGGRLGQAGFRPIYFRYRSRGGGLAKATRELREVAEGAEGARVHLVGHSLGGVVIARMFEEGDLSRPGRVAMLGTPMAGSTVGRKLAR